MGMFDDLRVQYPLPDPQAQHIAFQTKSLDCLLNMYIITAKGRLVREHWEYQQVGTERRFDMDWPIMKRVPGSRKLIDLNYHGDIIFYGDAHSGEEQIWRPQDGGMVDELHPGPRPEWFEYQARFTDGQLAWIRRIPEG